MSVIHTVANRNKSAVRPHSGSPRNSAGPRNAAPAYTTPPMAQIPAVEAGSSPGQANLASPANTAPTVIAPQAKLGEWTPANTKPPNSAAHSERTPPAPKAHNARNIQPPA